MLRDIDANLPWNFAIIKRDCFATTNNGTYNGTILPNGRAFRVVSVKFQTMRIFAELTIPGIISSGTLDIFISQHGSGLGAKNCLISAWTLNTQAIIKHGNLHVISSRGLRQTWQSKDQEILSRVVSNLLWRATVIVWFKTRYFVRIIPLLYEHDPNSELCIAFGMEIQTKISMNSEICSACNILGIAITEAVIVRFFCNR